jgi:hypothetical protein
MSQEVKFRSLLPGRLPLRIAQKCPDDSRVQCAGVGRFPNNPLQSLVADFFTASRPQISRHDPHPRPPFERVQTARLGRFANVVVPVEIVGDLCMPSIPSPMDNFFNAPELWFNPVIETQFNEDSIHQTIIDCLS